MEKDVFYHGWRVDGICFVDVVSRDGSESYQLPPRLDLRNHSPTGFSWGYSGSGPAQLALALCAHALGDDEGAVDVYQDFKFAAIAGLSGDEWELTRKQIRDKIVELLNQ